MDLRFCCDFHGFFLSQREELEGEPETRCGRGITFPGWAAYNKSLDEKPLITKAITSLVGWFLGDLVTQVRIRAATSNSSAALLLTIGDN